MCVCVRAGNPFWDRVSALLSKPTEEEIACQAPKPILLNTGDLEKPYQWDPDVNPLQIFRIGNVVRILFLCVNSMSVYWDNTECVCVCMCVCVCSSF
jgi:hypothetical protein